MKLEVQNHEQATHTKKITKADGSLDGIENDWEKWKRYRALLGWPGAYFTAQYRGEPITIKIKRAHWDGCFVIDEVVPQNQKTLPYEVFLEWLKR
jgi:methionyl-tRNA formyltransferase